MGHENLRRGFNKATSFIDNTLQRVPANIPIAGSLVHKIKGGKESIKIAMVAPIAVSLAEFGLFAAVEHFAVDTNTLFFATFGVTALAQIIERESLIKRTWSSNLWSLYFNNKLAHQTRFKNKAVAKILQEPLLSTVLAKLWTLVSYPPNLAVGGGSLLTSEYSHLFKMLSVQALGDLYFALLNLTEINWPGSIKKSK